MTGFPLSIKAFDGRLCGNDDGGADDDRRYVGAVSDRDESTPIADGFGSHNTRVDDDRLYVGAVSDRDSMAGDIANRSSLPQRYPGFRRVPAPLGYPRLAGAASGFASPGTTREDVRLKCTEC